MPAARRRPEVRDRGGLRGRPRRAAGPGRHPGPSPALPADLESGPPEAIIPILIMPRTPPPSAAPGAKPTQIRLHRRPQRFADEPPPVAPLVVPTKERGSPGQPPGRRPAVKLTLPRRGRPGRQRPQRPAQPVGCANPTAAGLTRAEREACEDRLAAGAATRRSPGWAWSRARPPTWPAPPARSSATTTICAAAAARPAPRARAHRERKRRRARQQPARLHRRGHRPLGRQRQPDPEDPVLGHRFRLPPQSKMSKRSKPFCFFLW